jgi:hypothetical protein
MDEDCIRNGIDLRDSVSQIKNAQIALYSGDKGSAIAALKKAEKLILTFCGYNE